MSNDTTDDEPAPDPDIMQYLEDRYGDDAQEIDYEPYPDHNFTGDPPDPRPGVYYIRLNAATLEFQQSTEGGDAFCSDAGVENLHKATVAFDVSLKSACDAADKAARELLSEELEVLG